MAQQQIDVTKLEELVDEVKLYADCSCIEVKTVLDDTIQDSYGESFLNLKIEVKDTEKDNVCEVLIKQDYSMHINAYEDVFHDFSGEELWKTLYFKGVYGY